MAYVLYHVYRESDEHHFRDLHTDVFLDRFDYFDPKIVLQDT